ncbi:hypothetical protein Pmani_004737 [Petrolisthes manimaculis]|uniref:Mutator-like transposase domain-containing protein n=1 Tax=Petrolisthes manimaculis TaxID=1843537 RepID=A0AAE1QD40_9EUCA|nr:hypothetical protein Pmani_004737 [Petrolisthes manimaculis]
MVPKTKMQKKIALIAQKKKKKKNRLASIAEKSGMQPQHQSQPSLSGMQPQPQLQPSLSGMQPQPQSQPGLSGVQPQPQLQPSPSGVQPQPQSPASVKRKLRLCIPPVPLDRTEEYLLVSQEKLLVNYKEKCEHCKNFTLDSSSVTLRLGAANRITSECRYCGEKCEYWTSYRYEPHGKFDVNMKLVEFALENNGYKTIQDMEKIFEMKIMASSKFFHTAKDIEARGIEESDKMLRQARELVHEYVAREQPDSPEVKDIAVTCDGTLSNRGFVAKFCILPVIHFKTGLVVDYELLSKYCHVCEKNKDNEGDWYTDHEPKCYKNFEGSSPAMETEGWMCLWKRSVEKCKFRYTTVISDGDSKAYSTIVNEKIYGEVEIRKDDCINHISKRVGKALRNYVQKKSRKGSLTQVSEVTLGKIQEYYRKAIIRNKNVEKMRKAIFAIIEHCSSTDDDPCHELCPEGVATWCFFNRAKAVGKPAGSHEQHVHYPIHQDIKADLYAIMRKYSTDDLLSRCIQNDNESLNSVMWNKCSKNMFYHKDRLHYLIAKAITEFNMGFVHAQGIVPHGKVGKIGEEQDNEKCKKFEAKQQKEERSSKKLKAMEEERRHDL